MKVLIVIFFCSIASIVQAEARIYEVPPSGSTGKSVPVISDKEMEECVKLYNNTNWLIEELDNTQVDQYSGAEVDAYNEKVSAVSEMNADFNKHCAGKQSKSAYDAAEKLNREAAQILDQQNTQ
jgi:hypothetical protein